MNKVAAIVMAGGRGARMRSASTKMLMPILGRPVVFFPTQLALECADGPVVVVSGDFIDELKAALKVTVDSPRLRFAHQEQPLGTADAVRAGLTALGDEDGCQYVLILNGDVPGTSPELLARLTNACVGGGADIAVLGFKPADPTGYGRVMFDDSGTVYGIKEEKELEEHERSIDVVNAGLYLVRGAPLRAFLKDVKLAPNQREFLLTDVVEHIVAGGGRADVVVAANPDEVAGINDRAQLAGVTEHLRCKRNQTLMLAGVGMLQPATVEVEFGVEVAPDSILESGVSLRGETTVGAGCTIGQGTVIVDTTIADHVTVLPYCMLESSDIGPECTLGPFAHTRPGTVLKRKAKVGNFVETKKTILGEGAKASHLTYLGDATVGEKVNIGAGTITCNYDGYRKYPTVIEDGAFIGSDTQFVAPVTIGRNAVVAAGTTVTRDVPPGNLAISRVDQANRPGYADLKRKRMQEE
jgi:bifunctional UDP-N-acetylglucosamine pyrophosphorylase / glucosamine-1-phosphate N-acetyltransferase